MKLDKEKSIKREIMTIEDIKKAALELSKKQTTLVKNRVDWSLIKELKKESVMIDEIYLDIVNNLKTDEMVVPAEEWLLDNYYAIKDQIREIEMELPKKYYSSLPKLSNSSSKGQPRIYIMANKLVEYTDLRVNKENIIAFISAYQQQKVLTIAELWSFPLMLRISLVQKIYYLVKKIKLYNNDKFNAEKFSSEIIKQIDEDYEEAEKRALNFEEHTSTYITTVLQKLRDLGEPAAKIVEIFENQLLAKGTNSDKVIHAENQIQTAMNMHMGNAVTSLKDITALDWKLLFEQLSKIEEVLRRDPANVYDKMDFESRDKYRHKIEEIAANTDLEEYDITNKLIEFSKIKYQETNDEKMLHIGYFLLSNGTEEFERYIEYKPKFSDRIYRSIIQNATFFYLSAIAVITIAILVLLTFYSNRFKINWVINILIILAGIIPASDVATTAINYIVTKWMEPKTVAKLDFSDGIPEMYKTVIVVPCILSDEKVVKKLVEQLEVHYLSNRENNLFFALLGDVKDSKHSELENDKNLINLASEGIEVLNKKYGERFFLFNRYRKWNKSENKWMGWERKRGKLLEFNRLLRGDKNTTFDTQIGNLDKLNGVKYVVTLDADTKAPMDSVKKLIGTMAHPLNRPVLNHDRTKVIDGYGILQPRIAVTINSANNSFFAKMFSGQIGIDPYTSAVSDVYQDLFNEGIYTGKGIYDLDVFQTVLENVFPENLILSHDLLEGCYLRTCLTTDIELADGYPSKYNSYSARLHRWVRGDWQISPWMGRWIRNSNGEKVKNPLNTISKWKIVDNLRRSLLSPMMMLFIVLSLVLFPGNKVIWLSFVGLALIFPILAYLGDTIISRPHGVNSKGKWLNSFYDLKALLVHTFLSITFLPYQAYLMLDAICTSLGRLIFTHKHLLEWETAADCDARLKNTLGCFMRKMWSGQVQAFIVLGIVMYSAPNALAVSMPFIIIWLFSPYIAYAISKIKVDKEYKIRESDIQLIRRISRKTWEYFDEFVSEKDNYLAPDNYQEDPQNGIAHRTSPTNIGLSLLANISANDMGYIGISKLLNKTERIIGSLKKLPKWKGHFYNWYDTQTMEPLKPLYVSSVDSGNLIVYLLTLKQGISEIMEKPIVETKYLKGIRDNIYLVEMEGYEEIKNNKLLNSFIIANKINCSDEAKKKICNPIVNIIGWYKLLEEIVYIEKSKWSGMLKNQIDDLKDDISSFMPWVSVINAATHVFGVEERNETETDKKIKNLIRLLEKNNSINMLFKNIDVFISKLDQIDEELKMHQKSIDDFQDKMKWLSDLRVTFYNGKENIVKFKKRCDNLIEYLDETVKNTDFKVLYDEEKQLFAIGYLVGKERLDLAHYDLLASECRQTSFIAIAKGDVPQKHWFRLSRAITAVGHNRALLSWTGTMFEYLMPLLIMKNSRNTLFDQTYKAVVDHQINYCRRRNIPWGISESGFYAMDMNYNYQYKAFGVPGLGYKRGLGGDLVAAPYAAVLALQVYPQYAIDNIKRFISMGLEGEYGLYEAVDFTDERVRKGKLCEVVKSFMVHHQGMSILSIDNFINGNIMQKRFHAEPMVKAAELLLEERAAKKSIITKQHENEVDFVFVKPDVEEPVRRKFHTADTITPEAHVLSNGRYYVMVTNKGSGFSSYDGISITRWREDPTLDNWGSYIYIKNLNSMDFWSASYGPCFQKPDKYEVVFFPDRAVYSRSDGNIDTRTEIVVVPNSNVEVRRVSVTNHSEYERTIELTSYSEVVLAPSNSDIAHPAFGNLFVRTEYMNDLDAIIVSRRPRTSKDSTMWLMHTVTYDGGEKVGSIEYETDRSKFIGRKKNEANPSAMDINKPLNNSIGAVLDPCISLRLTVNIPAGGTSRIVFSTGVGASKDEVLNLAKEYHDYKVADRAIDMAWTHSQVEFRYLNINSAQANTMQKILSSVLYLNPLRRLNKEAISKIDKGQSGLWAYGISGDIPIVLLKIKSMAGINAVKQLLLAHAYWRLKGVAIDLVILNEDNSSYTQPLRETINNLIAMSKSNGLQKKVGNIFTLQASTMTQEDKNLIIAVSRIVFEAEKDTIAAQINREIKQTKLEEVISQPQEINEEEVSNSNNIEESDSNKIDYASAIIKSKLKFYNGYGGFNEDTREYVILLDDSKNTPAPWINVISNGKFGFHISETGAGYTWSGNSRENKITTWSNDAVKDTPSEVAYIRNDDTSKIWSITASPVRDKNSYIARHGQGYSIFEHVNEGIKGEQTIFAAIEQCVKFCKIKLKNMQNEPKNMSITYYAELVLGVYRQQNIHSIMTYIDEDTGSIFMKNGYSEDFGNKVAFLYCIGEQQSYTGDRTEFLGRNGKLSVPEGLKRIKLSNTLGAGYDPCVAVQTKFELKENEEREIVFLFGEADSEEEARKVIKIFNTVDSVYTEFNRVKEFWNEKLNILKVSTPNDAMNIMLNSWLLYQTLSCRVWARSAFYQSGGAYGFRDQLQDVMALMYMNPDIAKNQIIRCCEHQFVEGDVQHWWHEQKNKGIRTKFSDDLLWLPYVTCEYINKVQDWSILEQQAGYLEDELLGEDEDERYNVPKISKKVGSVYEHCLKAIEQGMKFGEHGIPLMGIGDWNDGMSNIGPKGKGESVWVGWFLYTVLERFKKVCIHKGDISKKEQYEAVQEKLRKSMESNAWDGGWYRRAYFDDGTPLGSINNEECKIDSISQSWSVISGAASETRARDAMAALENYLVDKDNGLIKLLTPAFDKSELEPGYIKGYVPGVRENGGQYTHAAIWTIVAFSKLKMGDKAVKLYNMLNPINHAKTANEVMKYKVEPYVMCADVYAVEPHVGRGGWTWYTGAAGWMYKTGIESILGFTLQGSKLSLNPCIPKDWKEYSIHYKYKDTIYDIKIKNPNRINTGIESIYIDGVLSDDTEIELLNDKKPHIIEAVMGHSVNREKLG